MYYINIFIYKAEREDRWKQLKISSAGLNKPLRPGLNKPV